MVEHCLFHEMTPNWTHVMVHFMTAVLWTYFLIKECQTKKVSYLNIERPFIDYYDPAYIANVSVASRRYNRTDFHHYFTLEFDLLKFDNHCVHSFSFYEVLSPSNKRRIVELHYDFCDWAENDHFFGAVFRDAFLKIPLAERPMPELKCPLMPGRYSYKNMLVPMLRVPLRFPVQDGRIYYNLLCKNKVIAKSHVDFQIQERNVKNVSM